MPGDPGTEDFPAGFIGHCPACHAPMYGPCGVCISRDRAETLERVRALIPKWRSDRATYPLDNQQRELRLHRKSSCAGRPELPSIGRRPGGDVMHHDQFCERDTTLATILGSGCKCATRAYAANPLPDDLTPIWPSGNELDELDPQRLARVTGYSCQAWESALNAAHWIPEPALVRLVSGGAWPGLIANLAAMQDAIIHAEAIAAFGKAYPAPPTGVRERALWARQHRNTGPERGPIWRQPGGTR